MIDKERISIINHVMLIDFSCIC